MLSSVEVASPHRITIAIGVWISLPGSPAAERQRDQRQARGERGHQDRDEPLVRAALDRLAEVGHALRLASGAGCARPA